MSVGSITLAETPRCAQISYMEDCSFFHLLVYIGLMMADKLTETCFLGNMIVLCMKE
jgi:hypothetical protein